MKILHIITALVFASLLVEVDTGRPDSTHEPSTCLPMNEDNIEVLNTAITEPDLDIIWSKTNIHGVTLDSVSYVTKADPNCLLLLNKYEFWINEMYEDSNVNVHMITFHKFR